MTVYDSGGMRIFLAQNDYRFAYEEKGVVHLRLGGRCKYSSLKMTIDSPMKRRGYNLRLGGSEH